MKDDDSRLKYKQYLEFLYKEPNLDKLSKIQSCINRPLKKYKKYKELRTDEEVLNKLKEVYINICKDIAKDKFEEIRDYL